MTTIHCPHCGWTEYHTPDCPDRDQRLRAETLPEVEPLRPAFSGVGEIARLQEREAKLVALLRRVEWSGELWVARCPRCGGRQAHGGHEDNCELAEAIR